MKHRILASLFIVFSSFAKAQLNQSQSQIMQLMSNDNNWTFDKSGHDKDGAPYLQYKSKEKNRSKAFLFKNDSCALIDLMIPNDQLSDVIKDMNSRFISNGNNLWTDNKEKIQYAIILTDNQSYFQVYEVLLSLVTLPKKNSN